jgi:hypothetical protein
MIIIIVAIQFLIHVFNNFSGKIKNCKKTMKTLKNIFFDIFALFLAFLTLYQKNLNF